MFVLEVNNCYSSNVWPLFRLLRPSSMLVPAFYATGAQSRAACLPYAVLERLLFVSQPRVESRNTGDVVVDHLTYTLVGERVREHCR